MSYDIWFTVDVGGPEPIEIGGFFNYTSNLGPWFRAVFGDDEHFKSLHGRLAHDVAPFFEKAIACAESGVGKDIPNPANAWGSKDGALEFLKKVHAECLRLPRATFMVCS